MSVAITKWTGPSAVAEAIDAIDGWQSFEPGMNVLIKPNVVMGGSPKVSCRGITTSPEIVGEIVRLAREKGAKRVVIAEGSVELPTLKLDTNAAYLWSGLQALAEKENVPLIDMNKGPYRPFTLSDGTEIEIAEAVFEADFVINVPILKTHNQTVTTVCLKNLKGCLAMESKKKCHVESSLSKAIAEFNQFIPCHLNVVDALTATEIGPTPTGKVDQVREMGLVLASTNRLECDVVGSHLLGYKADKVPHIAHYSELTGQSLNFEDVTIVGENPADYCLELDYVSAWLDELMERFAVTGMTMPYYGDGVCSACGFNAWAGVMDFCRSNKGAALGGAELCMGTDVKPSGDSDRVVLVGKCAIRGNKELEGAIKIPGCPPDPGKMSEIMSKALVGEAQE